MTWRLRSTLDLYHRLQIASDRHDYRVLTALYRHSGPCPAVDTRVVTALCRQNWDEIYTRWMKVLGVRWIRPKEVKP